ncbi:MAG: 3-oxoacyl-ACP synthase [Desulfobacterales bacterium CG23_combo_of_CG06-09_8_20_14_all_51_8]|nr:MAG: 3-oxoacyl-ACP synthase [Desulfobacterales bacterium CG23_combo_of_CG06-09_8_20_14_all_51_8]
MKKMIIRGTGRYLPERIVTNADMTQWMDTSDEWIEQRTGIKERRWIPEEGNVGASDLGLEASKIALARAGWTPEDLDLIIFATLSPDINFPGSGCLLQSKLGLKSTPALDIRQQCTGFLYGMQIADAYIKSGYANRILFVGSEVHSTGIEKATRGRDVTVIFGDGAGAVCLEGVETDENVGVLAASLHAQGDYAESLMLEAPASRLNPRLTHEMIEDGRVWPKMDGRNIFKLAITRLPEITQTVLGKAGLTIGDIDMVLPHQANLRINQSFQKSLGIGDDKIYNNIQKYGNTTAASIPIALDEVIEKKLIPEKNATVLFAGLGAGVTWGAMIYRFL